ncbi:MAG: Alcohol dehydrogenase GroES-like protein [Subtercola sp.]|nr:Alcohol dehydrogenase GroES-like protein [Subtercola sp.]
MKTVVWQGPGVMTLENQPEPEATPGVVVVRVVAAGICGSDLTAFTGRMGISLPGQIRGHEFSGVVISSTPENADWVGVPVAVNPLLSCNTCRACRRGDDNQCAEQVSIGIQRPGGFAELAAVPVTNLVALTPNVDFVAAATAEPLADAIHAVRLGLSSGPAEQALVIGAGSIGTLLIASARLLGVTDIVVLDPDTRRHDAAISAGGTTIFDNRDDVNGYFATNPLGGADLVFDVVGTPGTRHDAVQWTNRGGTTVMVGLHEDTADLSWRDIIRREITLKGSSASNRNDFRTAADWLNNGLIELPAWRADTLENAPAIFTTMTNGSRPSSLEKVMLMPAPN